MKSEPRGHPSFPDHILIWVAGLAMAPILFFYDWIQLDGLRLSKSNLIIGRDFLNVWTGGRLALSGQLHLLYDYQGYMDWQAHIFGRLDPYNYSYPPHSLFLAIPFASLPYLAALILWTVAGASFFLWAAKPYLPRNLPLVYAILTPAALVNIWAGHYGFFIGGLWLLFFSALKRHPERSGVFAALLTLKPHMGLLIAIVMMTRRSYGAVFVAIAVTLLLILLSGAAFGFGLWPHWIFDTSALQAKIMTAPGSKFYYLMMPSAFIALRDMPMQLAVAVHGGFAVAASYLFWKARHAEPDDLAFITASATALLLPYIFNYDLTVASLGFIVCLYRWWKVLSRWEKLALWLGFAIPLLVMVENFMGPIGLLVGLVVQVRHAQIRSTSPHRFAASRKPLPA
jgi:hypothetical protein